MENWQREYIKKNLPELSSNTIFNGDIQAKLRARNVLGQADIEKLNAEINQNGNSKASYLCYEWLMGRTNAYKELTKALLQRSQTGAARLLIEGVPKKVSDKPLTYLGISVNLEGFEDMIIEVNGKKLMIHEFLPATNYENLQQIFQDSLSELEIFDTFVMKQRTFVLANNTVPPKPPYYVPRFLSNRININKSIFSTEADGPDVFVFKKSLARYKLSQIVKPHFTDTSKSQLNGITSRFISLVDDEDWSELKKSAKPPIHLINYEANQDIYLLEDSSAPSDILRKLDSKEERVYMSEEELFQQQLSENCKSSTVCICDTPGMGKTFLLANIARLMSDKCTGRIVAFIQLTSFAKDDSPASPTTISEPETLLIHVLSYVSPHPQTSELLLTLIKTEMLRLEIFFDGFDEIPAEKVEWTKQVFRTITTNFSKIRIYITSRPHMRQDLEKNLGVVAYDILPFNQQNQVNFLVQFWQMSKPDTDQLSLESYAISLLEAVNKSVTKDEKEIAGIPFLCQLIAEVYSDKITVFKRKFCDVPFKISGMYQKFIERKINLVAFNVNLKLHELVKLAHIWHALKLLFPTNEFHEDKKFQTVKGLLTSPKMLRVGILQKHSHGALEFIHRTFAEYLVAEYFFTKLMEMKKSEEVNCESLSILNFILKCRKNRWQYEFDHPVIVAFVSSALVEDEISEELKMQAAAFVSSISHEEFNCILCACSQHNSFNIFCLLTQSLSKWDNFDILKCFTNESSYKLLQVCIKKSTTQLFQKCIQLLAEVLKLDLEPINTYYKGWTLLQIAVNCANYEAVEYFVDRTSLQNQSILKNCVELSYGNDDIEKRVNILHMLLNKDPTLIHENLDILIKSNIDVTLFKILVEFGANLTAASEYYGNCAMIAAHYMSSTNYHKLVQFLLTECKADYLFVENEKWKYPLPYIIRKATLLPETLELLLNIPGNHINMKDRYGYNLLFYAVTGNKSDTLQQLVKRGLDHNERGTWNRSLLHVAAQFGRMEMVRYLLSLKLDPNTCDGDECTPLHYAAESKSKKLSVVKVLVENGANLQAKNYKGQTALHSSAYQKYPDTEVIKYLIGKGLGVNNRDNDENTPLHLCEWKEALDCLIEMGADIHVKNNKGQTALHTFVQQHNPDKEVIKYLSEKGVGVNDRDKDGNTPLHLCWEKEGKYFLIEMGANIHAKNIWDQTPAQMNPDLWK